MRIPIGLVLRHEFQDPKEQAPPPAAGRETSSTGVPPPTDTPSPGGGAAPGMCGTEQLLMMGGMLAIFYFLLIRPQQKLEKQRRAMIASAQKGDQVVTSGGIHGTIAAIDEGRGTVTLRTDADGKNRLTVDRVAIARVLTDEKAKSD